MLLLLLLFGGDGCMPIGVGSRSDTLALLQATERAVAAAQAAQAASAAAARGPSPRAPAVSAEANLKAEAAAAALARLEVRLAFLRGELGLLTALRADFTQDEGAYSRYLDKDEWYERDRRRVLGLDKPKK